MAVSLFGTSIRETCLGWYRESIIRMLPRPVGRKRTSARREQETFGLASRTYSGSSVARA